MMPQPNPPAWIEVAASGPGTGDPELSRLDDGERAAIELPMQIRAELILMDDRDGVNVARSKGFAHSEFSTLLPVGA